MKQQQAHLTTVLQGYDDDFKLTKSQREYRNLLGPKGNGVEAVCSEVEPLNAQSRGVAEKSDVNPTPWEPPFSNHLSARETPVVSNSALAIPQLVHDDSGIKAHSHDTKQDMQCGGQSVVY